MLTQGLALLLISSLYVVIQHLTSPCLAQGTPCVEVCDEFPTKIVCGSDGKYYDNDCWATCAGVTVANDSSGCPVTTTTTTSTPLYSCPSNSQNTSAGSCVCSSGFVCAGSALCERSFLANASFTDTFPASCASCMCSAPSTLNCSSEPLSKLDANGDCVCTNPSSNTVCEGTNCGTRHNTTTSYPFFRAPCPSCFCVTPITTSTSTTTTKPASTTTTSVGKCAIDSNCPSGQYCFFELCVSCSVCVAFNNCPSSCAAFVSTSSTTMTTTTTATTITTTSTSTTSLSTSITTTSSSVTTLCSLGLLGVYEVGLACMPWSSCTLFTEESVAPSSVTDRTCSSSVVNLNSNAPAGSIIMKMVVQVSFASSPFRAEDAEVVLYALRDLIGRNDTLFTIFESKTKSGSTQSLTLRARIIDSTLNSSISQMLSNSSLIASSVETASFLFGRSTQFKDTTASVSMVAYDSKGQIKSSGSNSGSSSGSSSSSSSSDTTILVIIIIAGIIVLAILIFAFVKLYEKKTTGEFTPVMHEDFDEGTMVHFKGIRRKSSTRFQEFRI